MSTNENSNEVVDDFIKVQEKEDSDFMEFPKEEDDTVLLRTIQTQFSDAIGIRYKGSSGAWTAVQQVDNALVAPKEGWGDIVYSLTCSETKKRKIDSVDNDDKDTKYTRTSGSALLRDLVVIGLPYKTTDSEFKEYFEDKYGEVVHCQIKTDRESGKSRGFGFIRFKDEETAREALNGDNFMDGRKIQVKEKKEKPIKMYVSGLPKETTQKDLIEYFSQFGKVIDSHIPTTFRGYAFFTFSSTVDGRNCLQEEHTFRDHKLKVSIRRDNGYGNDNVRDGFGNSAGRGGFGNSDRYGGYGNRPGSSFAGGYNSRGYQDRNMPPPHLQLRNRASDVKNMLLHLLSG